MNLSEHNNREPVFERLPSHFQSEEAADANGKPDVLNQWRVERGCVHWTASVGPGIRVVSRPGKANDQLVLSC